MVNFVVLGEQIRFYSRAVHRPCKLIKGKVSFYKSVFPFLFYKRIQFYINVDKFTIAYTRMCAWGIKTENNRARLGRCCTKVNNLPCPSSVLPSVLLPCVRSRRSRLVSPYRRKRCIAVHLIRGNGIY